ncbi:DUF4446 family protein [Candidatus Woesebacteria bacterium]|nr:DUF4446 family protein [Candidatus Woesebacteria bacterium]
MQLENFLLIALGIWLLIVSGAVALLFGTINKLTKGSGGNFREILEKILSSQSRNFEDVAKFGEEVKRIDRVLLHIPKVSLIRFNPFKETGGDHSFVLALLDKKNTGVVVTVLHARQGTRIYAKEVINGKSEIELSAEERKALDKAKII